MIWVHTPTHLISLPAHLSTCRATSSSSCFGPAPPSVSAASPPALYVWLLPGLPYHLGPFLPANQSFLVPVGTPSLLRVGCGTPSSSLLPVAPHQDLVLEEGLSWLPLLVSTWWQLGGSPLCSCWNQAQVDKALGPDSARRWVERPLCCGVTAQEQK